MGTTIATPTRVIEVGETAAGIAVPDRDGSVRFFSALSPFDRLDGRVFRSADEASRAVRELALLKRGAGRSLR